MIRNPFCSALYIFNHLIYDNHCGPSHLFNGVRCYWRIHRMETVLIQKKHFFLLECYWFLLFQLWAHFHSIRNWSIIDSSISEIKHHFEDIIVKIRLLLILVTQRAACKTLSNYKTVSPAYASFGKRHNWLTLYLNSI